MSDKEFNALMNGLLLGLVAGVCAGFFIAATNCYWHGYETAINDAKVIGLTFCKQRYNQDHKENKYAEPAVNQ